MVKDKLHKYDDLDNYRTIILIPIISKVFEHIIYQNAKTALFLMSCNMVPSEALGVKMQFLRSIQQLVILILVAALSL